MYFDEVLLTYDSVEVCACMIKYHAGLSTVRIATTGRRGRHYVRVQVRRMVTLVKQIQGSLPADAFQGYFAQLGPHEQAVLQAALIGQ